MNANADPTLDLREIQALVRGTHGDPFARLGMHRDADGTLRVRAFVPEALEVGLIDPASGRLIQWLRRVDAAGLFSAPIQRRRKPFAYRLRARWAEGEQDFDDPYRFPPVLGEMDLWLFNEGRHLRPFERLGAHACEMDGVRGTAFAVWAPNATRVSVVGDFNHWDERRHPMRLRREAGLWEIFLPEVGPGQRYKYAILGPRGQSAGWRADPFGVASELRPATASVIAALPPVVPTSDARRRANAMDAPIAIYEVHLASWRRRHDDGNRFLTWDELADELIPYVTDLGFTHLELLPISEHPFDGSWGYQPIGMYAPTARHGDAAGLRRFVDRAHDAGLGVLLDWVPAHFPTDAHGLARLDGTALYEHEDPRLGLHRDWNTLIYNFGRREVANFLHGNALYWIERFGIDGLRVDAVASMLYRDYSRQPGEWLPNEHGGRENLEAVAFLRRLSEVVGAERPEAVLAAEESTAWPMVSRPPDMGGLGFHYKWNMGWMNDTLSYIERDPAHRRYHHDQLTFGLVYAFTENFILPLSHDEVVHGKRSLLSKMPGDRWQRFANLRAYLGFMYAHPGKKLLFMGAELAQEREWNHDESLDWHLLDDPMHGGVHTLVRDLNRVYRGHPALHRRDFDAEGFEWLEHGDRENSVLSMLRKFPGCDRPIVAVSNFTPVPRHDYRVGVPHAGWYREVVNTDSRFYGGSDLGNPHGGAQAQPVPMHGRPYSLSLTLPPLSTLLMERTP